MSDYGPNVTIPERHEAERDNHETETARGRCRPTDPCSSCRQALAARGRA